MTSFAADPNGAPKDGTFSGGGGSGVEVQGQLRLDDIVNPSICTWLGGEEFARSFAPDSLKLIERIKSVHDFLGRALERELSKVSFCPVQIDITDTVPPEVLARAEVFLDSNQRLVGFRANDQIVVSMPNFDRLPKIPQPTETVKNPIESDISLFVAHELLHAFLPMDVESRHDKLKSLVKALASSFTERSLGEAIRNNRFSLPVIGSEFPSSAWADIETALDARLWMDKRIAAKKRLMGQPGFEKVYLSARDQLEFIRVDVDRTEYREGFNSADGLAVMEIGDLLQNSYERDPFEILKAYKKHGIPVGAKLRIELNWRGTSEVWYGSLLDWAIQRREWSLIAASVQAGFVDPTLIEGIFSYLKQIPQSAADEKVKAELEKVAQIMNNSEVLAQLKEQSDRVSGETRGGAQLWVWHDEGAPGVWKQTVYIKNVLERKQLVKEFFEQYAPGFTKWTMPKLKSFPKNYE